MQLSRSPAQRSALRRTAGPYMLAHIIRSRRCSDLVRNREGQLTLGRFEREDRA